MTKAIIIDDEPLARGLVREYLASFPEIEIAAECGDGFEGLKMIQEKKPDLVFLDIQMPKINGFEMLELLDPAPNVIFTTAFEEYALKAFDRHAVDYLLKPFSKERFHKAIEKWKERIGKKEETQPVQQLLDHVAQSPQQKDRIVVKSGFSIIVIPVDDIIYIEAADDFVKIHTPKGSWLKNRTMTHFEQTLDNRKFIRTHRSYIVNITEATRLDPYEKDSHVLLLRSGQRIPVSKQGMGKIREILG
jgi:two-component system, LytTR family, response regulator